jgi:DNA-binding IclR family transcriptional regulator
MWSYPSSRSCAKSTVSRLTFTLTALGYLIHVKESGKYRLGTACLALGSAMLTRLHVREVAWPYMHELAQSSGLSVSLLCGTSYR